MDNCVESREQVKINGSVPQRQRFVFEVRSLVSWLMLSVLTLPRVCSVPAALVSSRVHSLHPDRDVPVGPATVVCGQVVDLESADVRSGGLLEARAPSESPPIPVPVSTWDSSYSSSLSRVHTSLQSGVVGSVANGWRAAFMPRKGYSSRTAERSRGIVSLFTSFAHLVLTFNIGSQKAATRSWTNERGLLHTRVHFLAPKSSMCQWGLPPGVVWLRSTT